MKFYYWLKIWVFWVLWMFEEFGVVYEFVLIDLCLYEQGSDVFV